MVSIKQTAKKYHGRKAETYDAIREKQGRWRLENEAVERMLAGVTGHVLDCPVGTGRFLPLYKRLKVRQVMGVDASESMLALAADKAAAAPRGVLFRLGDAARLPDPDEWFDVAVCVRFLDLIEEEAMRGVVRELLRVTRDRVILTIRLGDAYVAKVNTATHQRKGFLSLISKQGWRVAEEVPIFRAGWTVMCLRRK